MPLLIAKAKAVNYIIGSAAHKTAQLVDDVLIGSAWF